MESIMDLLNDVPKQNYEYRMRLIIDTIKLISSAKHMNKSKLMVIRFEDKLMTDFDSKCITLDDYRYQQRVEKQELRKERRIMLRQTNELIKIKNAEYDEKWKKDNPDAEMYSKIDNQIKSENKLSVSKSLIQTYAEKLSMDADIDDLIKYDLKSRCFLKDNGYNYRQPDSVHNNLTKLHNDQGKFKTQNEELTIKLLDKSQEFITINNRKTYLEALLTTIEEVNENKLSRMRSAISDLLYTTNEYLGETGMIVNKDDQINKNSTDKSSSSQPIKESDRSIMIKKKIAEYTDAYLKFKETVELKERVDDISDFYSNSDYNDDSDNEWDNECDY